MSGQQGKSNLRIGVAGTGIFATDKHLPTLNKIDNLSFVACYNRTKAKADTFAEKAGIEKANVAESLDELFNSDQVDAVDALLPVQYNLDAVKHAIKYNKPIALEKPISATLEQAREIVKISEATDLPIAVLENWSFLKAIDILKSEVLPKIGQVAGFTYRATGAWNAQNKYATTAWRQSPEHIGGYLSDGGVHQLALLTGVLGDVSSVSALTKQLRKESGLDDILFSTLKLSSGVIGTFTYGSAFGATDKSTSFTIYGTEGSVVYDFSPHLSKPTITYQTGSSLQSASEKVVIEVDEQDTFVAEFKNFAEAVFSKDKSQIKVPPAKAFHHLAIVGAALESSSKNGSSVSVEGP